jgi:muramoyltetrapeptide carboxypeptidase
MSPDPAPARPPAWPRSGQVLAVAAPAGAVDRDALESGLAVLAELAPGLRVRVDAEVLTREGYLAGGDELRAAHLARLLTEPGVGGVLAARGGFGASRLLPRLDLDRLAAAGRLVMGFSDLTALLNALAARGLIAVHGPVVTQLPRLDRASREAVAGLLAGRSGWPARLAGRGLAPGRASGVLWGGNLTMLCHLLGTPWQPPVAGGILCLEEVNEPAYRLDRLLTQLELAGVLEQAAGIAVGSLAGEGEAEEELAAVAEARLACLGKPVVAGLPVGHGPRNFPVPLGARAELDGEGGWLRVGLGLG